MYIICNFIKIGNGYVKDLLYYVILGWLRIIVVILYIYFLFDIILFDFFFLNVKINRE